MAMRSELENWFSANETLLRHTAHSIWSNPELSEQEEASCKCFMELLQKDGFAVEQGVAGLSTAFSATWGSGAPRIGFLAEYDALPGLAQNTVPRHSPIEGQTAGHGCGHNLLGTSAVGAGMALKAAMQEKKLSGTVVVYGCPSEEIMMGKIVMAEQGIFNALDVALSWHPGDLNAASEMSYQAMLSLDYFFTGRASHAAMAPEEGFSALDAVELMNVGANYLREHLPQGGQLHYTITHGGDKPNIVPEKAAVWYFIRANTMADVRRIEKRLNEIAQGAALMTGTTFETAVRTGCNETILVPELVKLMNDVMEREVAPAQWSEEEKAFSLELLNHLHVDYESLAEKFGEDVRTAPLHDANVPPTGKIKNILGSSDLSDVSWVTPTGMLFAACYPKGTPNHTWGVTACSGMSIGEKGMMYAARVMGATGLALMESAETLNRVKQSYKQVMGSRKYQPATSRKER